jgi:hypothetical protein
LFSRDVFFFLNWASKLAISTNVGAIQGPTMVATEMYARMAVEMTVKMIPVPKTNIFMVF